ncbi:hypothetical protein NA78x_003629 [Anatilimnocola sp. NA78]|uniref:hypothetical protein n=1 Tax=Anatilimnocola sp. NA78 TaxID=3415683 RepID=UPI003CE4B66B
MKLATTSVALLVLIGSIYGPVQAGWHHRHRHAQSQAVMPGYYVPGAAFDSSAQMQLSGDQLLALGAQIQAAQAQSQAANAPGFQMAPGDKAALLKKLIGTLAENLVADGGDAGDGDVDVGPAVDMSKVRAELRALKKELTADIKKVDVRVDKLDEEVKELSILVKGKTPTEVQQVLNSAEFQKSLEGILKPGITPEAAANTLKSTIEKMIK